MGLLDLKTDLKSLKYGNDQRGGGSSNQPYIVTPIPDGYADIAADFLLRNGRLNPENSLQDVSRLTKFFTDTKTPNGLLFTAKQELLERQNVVVPGGFNRIYNPLGTLAQAGLVSVGEHVNKQGFNFLQRGYFNGGQNGYYKFTRQTDFTNLEGDGGEENRLVLLYKIKQSGDYKPGDVISGKEFYNISSNPNYLFSYSGGPGSVLGVGNTNIRIIGSGYGNPFERTNNYKLSDVSNQDSINKGIYVFNYDLIDKYLRTNYSSLESNGTQIVDTAPTKRNSNTVVISSFKDYRKAINVELGNQVMPDTDYSVFNRQQTYLQDENAASRIYPNITYASDNINLTPPINRNIQGDPDLNPSHQTVTNLAQSDIVKFYIEVIDNNPAPEGVNPDGRNVFLFFRAYLESISDNFKADWSPYKYVGRAENFYKYGGFSRDFSLSFKVVATSRNEMIPIYQKLNYLASLTAPSYSQSGLMRGNFIRLTIGDYMSDVPCIIQSIGLKPIFEAGWDINRTEGGEVIKNNIDFKFNPYVGQLPKAIDVDLSIIPLHEFTPQLNQPYIGNDRHIQLNEDFIPTPVENKQTNNNFTPAEVARLNSPGNIRLEQAAGFNF
jgi:hypothetical protein